MPKLNHKYNLSNSNDVKEIINGCLKNDRKYQKILFENVYNKMMITAKRYIRDIHLAEDVVSDSFLKVLNKINTYNYKGSLNAWISRVVSNTAIDYIRTKKDFFLTYTNDECFLKNTHFEDKEFEFENLEEIKGVPSSDILKEIQNLPPVYRLVFNMHVFEEMPHKEISKKLDISIGTSKSNLSKARVKLRKKINNLLLEKELKEEIMKQL